MTFVEKFYTMENFSEKMGVESFFKKKISRRSFVKGSLSACASFLLPSWPKNLFARTRRGKEFDIYRQRELVSNHAVLAGLFPLTEEQTERQKNAYKNPENCYWVFRKNGGGSGFVPYIPRGVEVDQFFYLQNSNSKNNPFSRIPPKSLENGNLFFLAKYGDELIPVEHIFHPATNGMKNTNFPDKENQTENEEPKEELLKNGKIDEIAFSGILSTPTDSFPFPFELFSTLQTLVKKFRYYILKLIGTYHDPQGSINELLDSEKELSEKQGDVFCESNRKKNRLSLGYPGSGKTPPLTKSTSTIFNLLDSLRVVLQHTELAEEVDFKGHSMGAAFAFGLGLDHIKRGKKAHINIFNGACYPMPWLTELFKTLHQGTFSKVVAWLSVNLGILESLLDVTLPTVHSSSQAVTPEIRKHFLKLFQQKDFLVSQAGMISEAFSSGEGSWENIKQYLQKEFIPGISQAIIEGRGSLSMFSGEIDELVPASFQEKFFADVKEYCLSLIKKLEPKKKAEAIKNLKDFSRIVIFGGQSHMIPQEMGTQSEKLLQLAKNGTLPSGIFWKQSSDKKGDYPKENKEIFPGYLFYESNDRKVLQKYCRGTGGKIYDILWPLLKLGYRIGANSTVGEVISGSYNKMKIWLHLAKLRLTK